MRATAAGKSECPAADGKMAARMLVGVVCLLRECT